jgi:hypothetical protein
MRWLAPGLALLALLWTPPARADVRPIVIPVPVEAPERIDAGPHHYPVTPFGLRRYLDSIRETEPQLWRRLDPEVARLEARDSRAYWLGGGGLVLGLALAAGSLVAINNGHDTAGEVLAVGSLAAMGGGIISFLLVRPERADVIEVMNLHNRLGPESRLTLSSRGGNPTGAPSVRVTVASF